MSFRQWYETHGVAKEPEPLNEREDALMTKLAAKVVEWKMTVPAILFLESVKPLNFIGAQALIFFEPFVQTIFNFKDYDTFRIMMERRENVERLLQRIESLDADALEREKATRRKRRRERGRRWWWPFGGRGSEDSPETATDPPE